MGGIVSSEGGCWREGGLSGRFRLIGGWLLREGGLSGGFRLIGGWLLREGGVSGRFVSSEGGCCAREGSVGGSSHRRGAAAREGSVSGGFVHRRVAARDANCAACKGKNAPNNAEHAANLFTKGSRLGKPTLSHRIGLLFDVCVV